jgi:GTP 3',8-cyclase
MYDSYNRAVNYLRVSVTDRCNLRCTYCMPATGVASIPHTEVLTFEEIEAIVRHGVKLGISKVRITGGEPLVRKGITDLVRKLAAIEGITDLAMTTNGILLSRFAAQLVDAGLHRINISLDTINPERFSAVTRGGDVRGVMQGIAAAEKAGLAPLKINCVIRDTIHEPDAEEVAVWGHSMGYEVRFIQLMDLHAGSFSKVIGGEGGNCATCNRLRLTADGRLKPCLFNNIEYNIREEGIEAAFQKALKHKPACGSTNTTGAFYNIGG